MPSSANTPENILPYDGAAYYYAATVPNKKAEDYFQELLQNISWQHDEVTIFGKKHITRRKTAWYGDRSFEYKYSGKTRTALPWTDALLQLKLLAEQTSGENFNSCLLNLYHDGSEGMSWHADNEKMLLKDGAIASLSFGAQRKFAFKHKETKEIISVMLETGSMLVMKGVIQQHWLHALPKSLKVNSARINLTFRTIVQ